MKVKDALALLNELPPEAEICAQWYSKEDVEREGETISNEVWIKANRIMDRWSFSEFIELIEQAIEEAKEGK